MSQDYLKSFVKYAKAKQPEMVTSTNPEEQAFHNSIKQSGPEDDTARLAYSDWLQDNGKEEAANRVRWWIGAKNHIKANRYKDVPYKHRNMIGQEHWNALPGWVKALAQVHNRRGTGHYPDAYHAAELHAYGVLHPPTAETLINHHRTEYDRHLPAYLDANEYYEQRMNEIADAWNEGQEQDEQQQNIPDDEFAPIEPDVDWGDAENLEADLTEAEYNLHRHGHVLTAMDHNANNPVGNYGNVGKQLMSYAHQNPPPRDQPEEPQQHKRTMSDNYTKTVASLYKYIRNDQPRQPIVSIYEPSIKQDAPDAVSQIIDQGGVLDNYEPIEFHQIHSFAPVQRNGEWYWHRIATESVAPHEMFHLYPNAIPHTYPEAERVVTHWASRTPIHKIDRQKFKIPPFNTPPPKPNTGL